MNGYVLKKCKTEVEKKGVSDWFCTATATEKTPPTGKLSDFFAIWREEATKKGTLVAQILELAERLMGSKEAVEVWLFTPMQSLGQQRPIDAMETPKGAPPTARNMSIIAGRVLYPTSGSPWRE